MYVLQSWPPDNRDPKSYTTPFSTACAIGDLDMAQLMLRMELFPMCIEKKVWGRIDVEL